MDEKLEGENWVKVAVFGGRSTEVCVPDGTTVAQATKAAGIKDDEVKGRGIRINKRPCELTDDVFDGDRVLYIGKLSGG